MQANSWLSGIRGSFCLLCRAGLKAIHFFNQRSVIMNRREVLGFLGAGAASSLRRARRIPYFLFRRTDVYSAACGRGGRAGSS